MSGIINRIGARSGIISGGSGSSAGTVTLSGTTGLDYEEGTWTPQWVSTSASFSYTERIGLYTKIGRVVHISIHITLGSIPSGTLNSALYIETLPFTSSATYMGGISIGAYNNFNYPSTENVGDQFVGRINNSATVIEMKMVEDNGGIVNVPCNAITGGATFHASATYFV